MYLELGDISSVLTKFNGEYNRSKFLCLLIAGHLRDLKFFQDVFEYRVDLDIISGPNIAILLFTNDPVGLVKIDLGMGNGKIIPGQNLGDRKIRDLSYYRHISEIQITDDEREKIINASQSMAYQICDHFGLKLEDIPCILLLSKGNSEPSVIPTRGEADVQAFYNFLKGLRKIADVLPNDFDLNEPLASVKSLVERGELAEAVATLEKAELEFQEAKKVCIASLERFSVSPQQAQAFFKDDQSVRHVVGLVYSYPLPTKDILSHSGFQQAYEDAAFRERCKELGRALQRRRRVQEKLMERKKEAKQLLKWSENMHSIEEAIIQLCKQYEDKFLWRARLRPLRETMEKVVLGGKTVKDLISLEQTIKKSIGL
jgi:hypothetical protein